MSVQFGICNIGDTPVDPQRLHQASSLLTPYGPDGESLLRKDNIAILHRSFHTTTDSRKAVQPDVSVAGTITTWDGRLDNRQELIGQLGGKLSAASSDSSIAGAAYDRWGMHCFQKLIGDWAVSIWHARDRSLILARDFVGVRNLFYSVENDQVIWSTILDPLVLLASRTFPLQEEYIAGWLSSLPAPHLSPYGGIHAVPPSSCVLLAKGTRRITAYWNFDPTRKIRHRTDGEYEEHFRAVFTESVRRRLRSDTPILAELSGGIDSSSIVCTADAIMARGEAAAPRLDTVSFYDDSEPNWDERSYFSKVEQKRGRTGLHLDIRSHEPLSLQIDEDRFCVTPASSGRPTEVARKFAASMASQSSRVVLSGFGGDEVTGGVPTPMPELGDLLASCQLRAFGRRLGVWSREKRKPWLHLLFETLRMFLPPALAGSAIQSPPAWLHPNIVRQYREAASGYESRLRLVGSLPSFQESLRTLHALQRHLSCQPVTISPLNERRYPYLDRDLLEFLYAIPREQLVRPGQRRSLMRRALAGIVPDEILQRKRKGYVARQPLVALAAISSELIEMSRDMLSVDLGFVVESEFARAVERVTSGREVPVIPLMRTIALELWLRSLRERSVVSLNGSTVCKPRLQPSLQEYGTERILS